MNRRFGPRGCLSDKVDTHTVRLGGRYISLIKLHLETDYHRAHLSKVLSGRVEPSVQCARKIKEALQLTSIDELLDLIEDRVNPPEDFSETA